MRKFWIVATLILLWNVIGDIAYLSQASADLAALALHDPVQARALAAMPTWAWSAYAVAVWGGTLGAVLLLLRRKEAWWLFALSTLAVVVQFGWSFLGFPMIAEKGWSSAAFPLVIFVIALASTLFARAKAADGTLR